MSDTRLPVAPQGEPATNGDLRHRVQQIRLDPQLGAAKAGRSGTSWLPWVLCALLALTWAGVAVRSYHRAPEGEPAAAPPTGDSSAAATASPPSPTSETQWPYTGYIVPASKIAVSPIDVAGRIIELNVVEGKYYDKGAVLAKIDPASYQAAVDEATASLASAEAQLEGAKRRLAELDPKSVRKVEIEQIGAQIREAESQVARYTDEVNRLNTLGGVAPRELVQVRNDLLAAQARVAKLVADREILVVGPRKEKLDAARAEVAAAEANVTAARARLAQAKWRLDNCTIRAPISGTVLAKKAEEGNLVNPMAFAATSGSICDMADLSRLEVELEVAEREISRLQKGMPCTIRAHAYPNREYKGEVDRIMPIADRGKNIVTVRVRLTDIPPAEVTNPLLKPEMGAVVTFRLADKR